MDYRKQFAVYHRVEEGKGERTISAYLADVRRFRAWLDEHAPVPWEQVQTRHLRAYMAWLSDDHTVVREDGSSIVRRAVGAKYIGRVTSSLREWFRYLEKIERLIENNPAAELKKPKIPKRHPNHLSAAEVSKLIQAAVRGSRLPERVRNWTLIAFLFHTGMRVSELCNTRVSDIRYKDGLPSSLKVIGKGNKERTVRLNPEGSRALYNWLQERAHIEAAAPIEANTSFVWLIPCGRKRGQVLTPDGVRKLLQRFGKLAGITKPVHPHLLRHSFATEAVRNGAKIHGLQRALDHASIATTGVYLFADEDELEQVVGVLPSVLGKAYREATEGKVQRLED